MKDHNFLFGKKALLDALESNLGIEKIYLNKPDSALISILNKKKVAFEIKGKDYFSSWDKQGVNHQFCVAILKETNLKFIDLKQAMQALKNEDESIVLILDSIQDSRNFGAILRSAQAFGIKIVFFKDRHQSPINDLVIKTSMGAANYLTFCKINNLSTLIDHLKTINFWVYATVLDSEAKSLYDEKFTQKTALIVGNEDQGVSQKLIENVDQKLYIPMYGNVQSLNVSVATGICLSYLSHYYVTNLRKK